MLQRWRGKLRSPGLGWSWLRRVGVGAMVVLVAGGVGIVSSRASGGASRLAAAPGDLVTFHVVFSGSGNATSAYPPAPSNTTVFTTSIGWSIGFDVAVRLGAPEGGLFVPGTGSTLSGVSNGVADPAGWPIEPGCEQINLLLDGTATTANILGDGSGPTYDLTLITPGFNDGALLAYQPSQCGNPFPEDSGGPDCPDSADYWRPTVQLDPNKAEQTWPFTEHCDIPDEGQTASWSGTVTVTRTSPAPGTVFAGHTSQRCSRWDSNCSGRGRLPIVFESRGNLIEGLQALDEGRCNHKLRSQDLLTRRSQALGAGGAFTIKYRLNRGAFVATIKGTVTASGAHGLISATGRYNLHTHRPDPHGRIICKARKIKWQAAPSP